MHCMADRCCEQICFLKIHSSKVTACTVIILMVNYNYRAYNRFLAFAKVCPLVN